MKRRTRNILISTLSLIPIGSVIASTVVIVNAKNISNKSSLDYINNNSNLWLDYNSENVDPNSEYAYLYNGVTYASFDDIIKSFLNEKNNGIKSNFFVGNVREATNSKDDSVDINLLREYNPERFKPAYKQVDGSYSDEQDTAIQSYLHLGNVDYLYSDFNGKLFETPEEASDSILRNKIPTPLMYYTVNGKKINPLSKTDLKLFKKDIYESIRKYLYSSTKEEKIQNNISKLDYSLNVYDFSNKNNQRSYSSANSSQILNNGNYSEQLINKIFKKIYNSQLAYINNNAQFDVDVSLRNIVKDSKGNIVHYPNNLNGMRDKIGKKTIRYAIGNFSDEHRYTIESSTNTINSYSGWVGDSDHSPFTGSDWDKANYIRYKNMPMGELPDFNLFLDNSIGEKNKTFLSGASTKVTTEGTHIGLAHYDLSKNVQINNFKGTSFEIGCAVANQSSFGYAWSNAGGWDFIPFEFGTHRKCSWDEWDLTCAFDVDIKLSDSTRNNKNFNSENMLKYVEQKLIDEFTKDSKIINNNSNYEFTFPTAVEKVWNIFKNNWKLFSSGIDKILNNKNNWKLEYRNSNKNLQVPNQYGLESLDINIWNIDSNNPILFDKTSTKTDYNYLTLSSPANANSDITFDGINILGDKILSENSNEIKRLVEDNKFRVIIEYKNNPLFLIDVPINLNSSKSVNELIKEAFFYKEKPTDSDLNKMQNYSQKYASYNSASNNATYFNLVEDNNVNKISLDDQTHKWKFNYSNNDGFDEFHVKPKLYVNDVDKDIVDSYKLDALIDSYNKIIENNKGDFSDIKDLNSPEDIIFLYDQFPGNVLRPMSISYREFLSNGTNQALSIYNNQTISTFAKQSDMDNYKKNNVPSKPAKVIMFYDNLSRPINPGIVLNDEQELLSTSDAIYDSKKTIMDNLIRSKIVTPSEIKTYHIEDDGEIKLLDKSINQIYTLSVYDSLTDTIDETHVSNYDHLWKYLNKYLTTKTKIMKII